MNLTEWLAAYDALAAQDAATQEAMVIAETTSNYGYADEARANLNEKLADLAVFAEALLRPLTYVPVTLKVENEYASGYEQTNVIEAKVPLPPEDDGSPEATEARSEWEMEHLFPHTGTGRTGDAYYTVTVTAAADESLVGYTAEWQG